MVNLNIDEMNNFLEKCNISIEKFKFKGKKRVPKKHQATVFFTWQIMCNLLVKSYIYLKNIISEDKSTAKFPKELRVEWEMGGRSETFQSSQGGRM